jgi:hypothetical protein
LSIRNYNAWLRAVRKEFGITQKQAQAAYRRASKRSGRSLLGVDVLRHPRITKDAVKRRGGPVPTPRTVKQPRKKGATSSTPTRRPPSKTIRSIRDWEEWLDEYDDYPEEEYPEMESGVRTGKPRLRLR